MKDLFLMYILRVFILSLILFYILLNIQNKIIRVFVLGLFVFILCYYWKYLKLILKPTSYYILIIMLSFLIASFIYTKNNKINDSSLAREKYRILVIRDTIANDSINLTLGKISDGNLKGKLLIIQTDLIDSFKMGDILETESVVKVNNTMSNSFDMLFFGKINYQLKFPELKVIGRQNGFWFLKLISWCRDKIDNNIKEIVGMKNYTLISMWLLGKTKVSDKELNDVFRNLGISHILVISGTHLTILFNVVGYLLLFIVANYWLNIGILALFLITFLFLTGMSSSILRATLFWVFLMLGKINSRITNYTNGLLVTLFVFFIMNPLTVVYDIGFHLSFLSIIALVYILPILNKLINCNNCRWKFVIDVFNSTLAVTILLLPYLVYQFTEFNILSIVFNIILIPISGIILSIAFIAIMLGFGSMILAKMLGLLVSWMVNVFLWILNILNIVSFKTNIVLFNSIFFVMIYYIILIGLVIDFYLKEKKLTFNL